MIVEQFGDNILRFLILDMLGTVFTGSNLTYAVFGDLDINNVDFTGANLSNALFEKG